MQLKIISKSPFLGRVFFFLCKGYAQRIQSRTCVCACMCLCVIGVGLKEREREREREREGGERLWLNLHFPAKKAEKLFLFSQHDLVLGMVWILKHQVRIKLIETLPSRLGGGGGRIHRLLLCIGVRLFQWVSKIWHKTIWWWGSSNTGDLGNAEYPFTAIAPRSTLYRSGCT